MGIGQESFENVVSVLSRHSGRGYTGGRCIDALTSVHPFSRLIRHAGIRWAYSTPRPQGTGRLIIRSTIDRSNKIVSNSNDDIVEICKIIRNINMSLAYNYSCCIEIYQVLITYNHDYFINRNTSS